LKAHLFLEANLIHSAQLHYSTLIKVFLAFGLEATLQLSEGCIFCLIVIAKLSHDPGDFEIGKLFIVSVRSIPSHDLSAVLFHLLHSVAVVQSYLDLSHNQRIITS
jgi:hypothetical protein